MRKVKQLKGWGIFQNNEKEIKEYGFSFTVLHPNNMDYSYLCSPSDSDMDCSSLEEAINWIKNY
jgi:predicted nucleotide-binding protein